MSVELKATKYGHENEENKRDQDEKVDFDNILSQCGNFGRFQILLIVLAVPFLTSGVTVYFGQLFMTEVPSHWCHIPELANFTAEQIVELAIPPDENTKYGYSQCKQYDVNWNYMLKTGERPASSWPVVPCRNGWDYNTTDIPYPTISVEQNWVCESDSNQAVAQTIFFGGSIVGGFIFGYLSDKFGRVPVIVLSNVVAVVGGVSSMFAQTFTQFSIIRFFTGIGYDNNVIMYYLLLLEYIAPKYRTLIANATFAVVFGLGCILLPWVALACGHWKTIAWVTSIPCVFGLIMPFVGIESPRWLLSKGRVDDTVTKLEKIARINRTVIPAQTVESFKKGCNQEDEAKGSMLDLIKRPKLRNIFILSCLMYMCNTIVYDALVRCLGILNFNFFVSFSVVNGTEIPALILTALIMDWLGRRWLIGGSLVVAGIFSILTAFTGGGLVSVVCAVIARFASNIAFGGNLQWVAEVMPTPIRGSAVSLIHICGGVAYGLAPLIVYLNTVALWLPLVVLGAISFVASFLSFTVPETAGKDLPQTSEEAENLALNQKFFEMPCLKKKNVEDLDGRVNISFE